MKLSEQLKQDHDSGDFGQTLTGYAESAAMLENSLWHYLYNETIIWGTPSKEASYYAKEKLEQLAHV